MIYDLFITTGPSKLSCLTPVTGKVLDKLKTKTVILERKNYPITEGFSSTLKHLQVCLPPSVCPRYPQCALVTLLICRVVQKIVAQFLVRHNFKTARKISTKLHTTFFQHFFQFSKQMDNKCRNDSCFKIGCQKIQYCRYQQYWMCMACTLYGILLK